MESLKQQAARAVKWYGLENFVPHSISNQLKGYCCDTVGEAPSYERDGKRIVVNRAQAAVINGHVECLDKCRVPKAQVPDLLELAVAENRINVVAYITEDVVSTMGTNRTAFLTEDVFSAAKIAAKRGNENVLFWCFSNKTPFSGKDLKIIADIQAAAGINVSNVQDYFTNGCEFPRPADMNKLLEITCLNRQVECFKTCLTVVPKIDTSSLGLTVEKLAKRLKTYVKFKPKLDIGIAILGGSADITSMIASRRPVLKQHFVQAARKGSVRLLEILSEKSTEWTAEVTLAASRFGHLECLKFAREHGCPWHPLAVVTRHADCAAYAKRGDDPPQDPQQEPQTPVVSTTTKTNSTITKEARLLFVLARKGPEYKKLLKNVEESTSVYEMLCLYMQNWQLPFSKLCAKGKGQPEFHDGAIRTKHKYRLDAAAYDWEFGSGSSVLRYVDEFYPDYQMLAVDDNAIVVHFISKVFTLAAWLIDTDEIYVNFGGQEKYLIPRKNFFIFGNFHSDREKYERLHYIAFMFRRPFEELFSEVYRRVYLKRVSVSKTTKRVNSLEEIYGNLSYEPPEEPGMNVQFVSFIRRHGVNFMRVQIPSERNLWKFGETFGIDHFAFQKGMLIDTRSVMKVPVSQLLSVVRELNEAFLFPVFLFSLPLDKLSEFYVLKCKRVESADENDYSRARLVSARHYCDHALV